MKEINTTKEMTPSMRREIKERCIQMKESGYDNDQIAQALGISTRSVAKYVIDKKKIEQMCRSGEFSCKEISKELGCCDDVVRKMKIKLGCYDSFKERAYGAARAKDKNFKTFQTTESRCIMLREEGLTNKEIAKALDLTVQAVCKCVRDYEAKTGEKVYNRRADEVQKRRKKISQKKEEREQFKKDFIAMRKEGKTIESISQELGKTRRQVEYVLYHI